MKNLAQICPLKSKLPGIFQRFNAINRSSEMLKAVEFLQISIKLKIFKTLYESQTAICQKGIVQRINFRYVALSFIFWSKFCVQGLFYDIFAGVILKFSLVGQPWWLTILLRILSSLQEKSFIRSCTVAWEKCNIKLIPFLVQENSKLILENIKKINLTLIQKLF